MATEVNMLNPNGQTAKGFHGWSWTSFFFGVIPAVCRGDWLGVGAGVLLNLVVGIPTAGLGNLVVMFVWAAFYNKWHYNRLVANGFRPVSVPNFEQHTSPHPHHTPRDLHTHNLHPERKDPPMTSAPQPD